MTTYTIGDTVPLSYTFLIDKQPSDSLHVHYAVNDEDGALLAGEEPALVTSVKKLPAGNRYRVKVTANVVIPDTSYDSLTIDFFLKDELVGIDEDGSTEIDVTVDIEQGGSSVLVALFNQDVELSTTLAFTDAQDASTTTLRVIAPATQEVIRGQPFQLTLALSQFYSKDLVLNYTARQLPPVVAGDAPADSGYIDSIQGSVTIPAFKLTASLILPSQNVDVSSPATSGIVDHAMLTFKAPVGTGIPDERTRLIARTPHEDEEVPRYLSLSFGKVSPGDEVLKVTVMDSVGQDMMVEPYTLGVQLRNTPDGSGHAGIDFTDRMFSVVISSSLAEFTLPLYYTAYPLGPFAEAYVTIENPPATGQEVQPLTPVKVIELTTALPEVPV
ncbi:hypothetical protein Peetri_00148 [Pseudomonas phage vB_PpuM-Peetri]